jgi:hypothetical protein
MTDTDAIPAPRPVLADYPGGYAVLAVATAAAAGGIFWFPLWFFGAQVLRLWAPRGGIAWLRSWGVPEYTDEQYATVITLAPFVPIAARIAVAADWLEPFMVFLNNRKEAVSQGEMTVLMDVVLGLAIFAALTGVMQTRGWPFLIALTSFAAVLALSLVFAFAPPFTTNGFAFMPIAVMAAIISRLAIFFESAPQRRALRAIRAAARAEDERRAAEVRKERGY